MVIPKEILLLRTMKKAGIFIGITFGLSWPIALLLFHPTWDVKAHTRVALSLYFMFTPLIATLVTQKWIFGETLAGPLRISFRLNRWFLFALGLPAVLALAVTGVSLLFPDNTFTLHPETSFAFQWLRQESSPEEFSELVRVVQSLPLHPFLLVLLAGTLAGLTLNGIAGFGEEIGWRGLLLVEFSRWGFWRSSLLTGGIWGLWHAPLILQGHNYPNYPLLGVFLMVAWTVLLSPLFSYVTLRARSVIAPALFHGALNGTAQAPLLLLQGNQELFLGILGAPGLVILLGFNALLILFGKPQRWHREFFRSPAESA